MTNKQRLKLIEKNLLAVEEITIEICNGFTGI